MGIANSKFLSLNIFHSSSTHLLFELNRVTSLPMQTLFVLVIEPLWAVIASVQIFSSMVNRFMFLKMKKS